MAMAQTVLLHAAIHWTEAADPSLWPMAVEHASCFCNQIQALATGLFPIDLWSKSQVPTHKLHNLHFWGSPKHVLQKQLANGKSIGCWEPRSQRCINIGLLDLHSTDAPAVPNLSTGSITTQWNVVFDDFFTAVDSNPEDLPDFNSEEWSQMSGTVRILEKANESASNEQPRNHTIHTHTTYAGQTRHLPVANSCESLHKLTARKQLALSSTNRPLWSLANCACI